MPVDDPNKPELNPAGNFETDIYAEHLRARLLAHKCQEVVGPLNGEEPKFMRFRKYIDDRWFNFTVPRPMGKDGYTTHELNFIERTLSRYDIELHPIDRHLH